MTTYAVKLERSVPLSLPRHPEGTHEEQFLDWCEKERSTGQLLAIDLFSGAGGLGVGVEAAGWTVVAAIDNDRAALETHRYHFRGLAVDTDMFDSKQVEDLIALLKPIDIDMIVGGPPCQPFSRAGRAKIRSLVTQGTRSKKDPRKDLWRSFIKVVTAIQPRAVIMENVPDMAIGDNLTTIREIASILENLKYYVDYRLLDAWRFGVPQHRKRFILQARNDGILPTWPNPTDKRNTVRDAIGDLPELKETIGARELQYTSTPKSDLAKLLRDTDNSNIIYDHMTRPVRDDDREAFALMTSTTLYSDLPKHLRRYRSDTFDDKYKRLDWNDLSRTITAHIAKDGYWYIHPKEQRTLTVREAARIQTFPDSFRFAGSRSDAYRQIGNAVPPLLGKFVANSILPCTEKREEIYKIAEIREQLVGWAKKQRESKWWLYPGPAMTLPAAAFSSLFYVHRMPHNKAEALMRPLQYSQILSKSLLGKIDTKLLSTARKELFNEFFNQMKLHDDDSWVEIVENMLGETQKSIYALLQGSDALILNNHVRQIVAKLMDLPEDQLGLRTGIKVALSQLVSTDDYTPLRMSAIRFISIEEALTYK